jgi:hypothetical protein
VAVVAALAMSPSVSTAWTSTSVGSARVSVKPAIGGPATRFGISFRTPRWTGRKGGSETRYVTSVTGPAGKTGCVDGADRPLALARAHARVKATFDPVKLGGRWCTGTFRGVVQEIRTPVCARGRACPKFVVLLGTVGRYRFKVERIATRPGTGTGDSTPPSFAGVTSATACTPGPQRPGQTTPFNLSWDAATDDVTPSSQIVYDVYESGSAGGEDFSHPSWTTPPGVTTFRTPGLPSHGTFYFVVRARDLAGNEDANTVEKLGVDPCL